MSKAVNFLNDMVTPKRKRLDELDREERPRKRSSTGSNSQHEEHIDIGNEATRALAKRSTTTLPRPSLNVLEGVKRSGRIYNPPESPEREVLAPSSASRQKPKTCKKRTLNSKKPPQGSPLKKTGFGTIGTRSDACLTSYNTPAKSTRSRTTQKTRQPRNAVRTPPQQVCAPRPEKEDEQEAVNAEADGELEIQLSTQSEAVEIQEPIQRQCVPATHEERPQPVTIGQEPSISNHGSENSIPDSEQSVVANIEDGDELPDDDALDAEIQRQHAQKPVPPQVHDPVPACEINIAPTVESSESESYEEADSHPAVSSPQNHSQGRRPRQTEEDKRARKVAQAQREADNREETEHAEATLFERRGRKFLEGIADAIKQARMGSTELWSTLGAAAMGINSMVEKKNRMDTTRAEALHRTLTELKAMFREDMELADTSLENLFRKLKQRASREHLKPNEPRRGDPTVVNLFEHIIPKSVHLIRHHLRNRFYEHDTQSWRELQQLVKATYDMCNIALGWQPMPSILETGIRGYVYSKIRPCLRQISQHVTERVRDIEFDEKRDVARREASHAQARALEQRNQQFAQWDDELDLLITSSISARNPKLQRTYREPVDIDDIADDEEQVVTQLRASRLSDPWTEVEDIALLNGLQQYRAADRFSQIRKDYPQLEGRSTLDCIARATHFKSKLAQAGQRVHWL